MQCSKCINGLPCVLCAVLYVVCVMCSMVCLVGCQLWASCLRAVGSKLWTTCCVLCAVCYVLSAKCFVCCLLCTVLCAGLYRAVLRCNVLCDAMLCCAPFALHCIMLQSMPRNAEQWQGKARKCNAMKRQAIERIATLNNMHRTQRARQHKMQCNSSTSATPNDKCTTQA